jgi:hypothetical protein
MIVDLDPVSQGALGTSFMPRPWPFLGGSHRVQVRVSPALTLATSSFTQFAISSSTSFVSSARAAVRPRVEKRTVTGRFAAFRVASVRPLIFSCPWAYPTMNRARGPTS